MVGDTALAANAALKGAAFELRGLNGWSAATNFGSEMASLVRSRTSKAMLRYTW